MPANCEKSLAPDNGRGDCCCNCIYQTKVTKHPSNDGMFKGSILDSVGFGCNGFHNESGITVFMGEQEHSLCEMHERPLVREMKA